MKKKRCDKKFMIKTAVVMLMIFAMLISGIPYSLIQSFESDDISAEIYAKEGASGMVEGSSIPENP